MKPTITNAFNDGAPDIGGTAMPAEAWGQPLRETPVKRREMRRNPRKSLAASLAAMQADLREASFGWSLELSPMLAIDAVAALSLGENSPLPVQYLVTLEQSAWRDGDRSLHLCEIAQRLAISAIRTQSAEQLVLDEIALKQLVSMCQPSRLVVIAVRGEIDERDAHAINKAVNEGRSPLPAELRAEAAMEVLGDRSVVLHSREKLVAHALVAENFRHYLAALSDTPAAQFVSPEVWQIERLMEETGLLTIRPIETQRFSTSIDVGINTARERFSQPANRSLIYDLPSHTWHDEP